MNVSILSGSFYLVFYPRYMEIPDNNLCSHMNDCDYDLCDLTITHIRMSKILNNFVLCLYKEMIC